MQIAAATPDQNQMPHVQVNEQYPLQCTTSLIAFNLSLLLLEQGSLRLSLPLHNFSCLGLSMQPCLLCKSKIPTIKQPTEQE
jgi:hypothetical protein